MATHFVKRAATAQVSLLRYSSTSSRNFSTRLLSPSLAAHRRSQVVIPHARASTVSGNGNGGKNGNGTSSAVNHDDINEALSGPSPSQSTPAAQAPPSLESEPLDLSSLDGTTDWSRSYSGLSQQPFPKEVADVLLAPIDPGDVEIKPDGLIYLPEIKYRRVLNKAFGPGGWGLAPRGETHVGPKNVSREYALVCYGRLVAIARGEQEYYDQHGIPTATEAAKSNALMRCCKDLGIASELWDPRFIREFKAKYCLEIFAEHVLTKKKKKLWRRKDQPRLDYPYKE